ncbi:MAG: tryptophan--tRNA ligase [Patescibacteria group bacterium]|jgi:tryptophanyl-tRNA synthetase|nr:tryptophan--tRNA ligase [Patescibacteria group bacterium]
MKRIFSGVQPSGELHLGNYLGAIKQWVEMQDEYESIFCVVDLHAITVKQKPDELRKKIIEIAKIYLAFGIDPKKSVIFQQSDISEHAEVAWILNTVARMSDLNKMTQFKDKGGESENIGVGLFDYPVLMASDILLYNTDVVPVGEDQKQHVELARNLAKRFNHQFGKTFVVPDVSIRKEGARIMGLDDPSSKMSKSASSELNYIALTDDPEKAVKKIMKAVTDTEAVVKYDKENKPGISNLLNIYHLLTDEKIEDIVKKYEGRGYGDFKKDLAEIVKNFLIDFQEKYNNISDGGVRNILDAGAKKIKPIAQETYLKVKKIMGIK